MAYLPSSCDATRRRGDPEMADAETAVDVFIERLDGDSTFTYSVGGSKPLITLSRSCRRAAKIDYKDVKLNL